MILLAAACVALAFALLLHAPPIIARRMAGWLALKLQRRP